MGQNGFIQHHGLATNTHDRAYKNGAVSAHSFAEKVSIGSAYVKAQEENGRSRPNILELAKLCKVSRSTILKTEGKIMISGKVADPVQIIHDKHITKRGHGVDY